jgi:hypothetical protein
MVVYLVGIWLVRISGWWIKRSSHWCLCSLFVDTTKCIDLVIVQSGYAQETHAYAEVFLLVTSAHDCNFILFDVRVESGLSMILPPLGHIEKLERTLKVSESAARSQAFSRFPRTFAANFHSRPFRLGDFTSFCWNW